MAHTNSTNNYELSQFIGTDKPTFLGDYNGDMQKIDTAIKGAKDTADGASTTASAASTLATSASETATQAATDAASAAANATTALNTANGATTTANSAMSAATSAATEASTAATKADAAKTEAEAATAAVALKPSYAETFARMFNMTSDTPTVTPETGITVATNGLKVASNTDKSLGKIYGQLNLTFSASTGGYNKVATIAAGFGTRDAAFNVTGYSMNIGGQAQSFSIGLVVETNGDVSVYANVTGAATVYINFPPCLLVLQDFGD
jgi:hypothetical protein